MIGTRKEIERRLSALRGLEVSGVSHAADMLTVQFGSLRPVTNFKGAVKHVGEWALHVQCNWRIERTGDVVATQNVLSGPDEKAHSNADNLYELLVKHRPTFVESVAGSELGGAVVALSRGLRLIVIPDGVAGDEDWRFFAPTSDAKHFVIEGGKVDPWSLS